MASNPDLPLFPDQTWDRIPNELCLLIFSYLEDVDLLRSVIPVCRRFRKLAYAGGFRFVDGSLGRHWGQWYRFSPEFLSSIQKPKSLRFTSSEQYQIEVPKQETGKQENRDVVSTIKTFSDVEKLFIEPHLLRADTNLHSGDGFLWDVLSIATNLKELVLVGDDDKEPVCESMDRKQHLLVLERAIAHCNKDLRKLRAVIVSNRAFSCITRNFKNLTHLHCRVHCTEYFGEDPFNDESIQDLRFLPQLSSLTLTGLRMYVFPGGGASLNPIVTPAGFDNLFNQNDGAFGRNLKVLDIEYSYSRYDGISFQRALSRCTELEELHLIFHDFFDSDFCPLRKLRNFKFSTHMDNRHQEDNGFDLMESIWANYPILNSLEVSLSKAYLTTCPDEGLKAIFCKLMHFKLIDRCTKKGNSEHLQFVERILPFCTENVLKSFHSTNLLHVDRDKHPKLEMINNFELERFSTCCETQNVNSPHQNSISFFELSWSNLKDLELNSVSDCCFKKICENCPGLSRLKILCTAVHTSHIDLNADTDNEDVLEMYHPAFDLALLNSLTRLQNLQVRRCADSSEAVKTVLNKLFKDCNRSFPRDPCGDRLTNFPAMENFRFVFTFMQLPEPSLFTLLDFEYNITRTCIGEIKRCIRTDRANLDSTTPLTNLSFTLKPSDISDDNAIPEDVSNALSQRINYRLNRINDCRNRIND